MKEQWGVPLSPSELTQCVRKFGPAVPPLAAAATAADDNDDESDQDQGNVGLRRRSMRRRQRAHAAEQHVTAAKLSATNGRELLLTYSGGPVALYDIFDEPERESDIAKSGGKYDGRKRLDKRTRMDRVAESSDKEKPRKSEFVAESLEEAEGLQKESYTEDAYVAVAAAEPIYVAAGSAEGNLETAFVGPLPATTTEDSNDDFEFGSEVGSDDDDDEDEEGESDVSSSSGSRARPASSGVSRSSTIPTVRPHAVFTGQRNVDTVKDVNFGSHDESLVVSGSDDGNVFIWSKRSGELVGIWKGDDSVVNVMQWHPFLPAMAVSGIDNSVKILAPTHVARKMFSRTEEREEVERRNRDPSWTSDRLGIGVNPAALLSLLERAGRRGEGDEGASRVSLRALLQAASEGRYEDGDDEGCVVM